MRHFINTQASDVSRSRTKSLLNLAPDPYPVAVLGENRTHEFFFHNNGVIETFSGNAANTLKVTLGDVDPAPIGGNYKITIGTATPALSYAIDAPGLQAALNALPAVTSDGGITVYGNYPTFFFQWNTVGVKTAMSADATYLTPQSIISADYMQTGDATHAQLVRFCIRVRVLAQQATWTTETIPYAGWTGAISIASQTAASILLTRGVRIGDFIQASTLLTVEVIDASGNSTTYLQTSITLRSTNLDLTTITSMPDYFTTATARNGFVQNFPLIIGLVGGTATFLDGIATAALAQPTGARVVINPTLVDTPRAWMLLASTAATNVALGIVQPADYNVSTNARVWYAVSV